MAATLERETIVTSTSRDLGHVPARWVTTVETDGGRIDLVERAATARHAPSTVTSEDTGCRFTWEASQTDATGEIRALGSVAAPYTNSRHVVPGRGILPYLDRSSLQQLAALLVVAQLQAFRAAQAPVLRQAAPAEQPRGAVHASDNAAVRAVDDLRQWLGLTVEDVARLAGVSRSAILYWKREHARPRPSAARNLFRIHALVRALRDAVAPEQPMAVLVRSVDGGPSPYDLLVEGRYDDAERLMRPLIFSTERQLDLQRRLVRWPDEEPPVSPAAGRALALRPPVRRARRVSLPK